MRPDDHPTAGRCVEAPDQAEQGRLATPARAGDGQAAPGLYDEVHALDGLDTPSGGRVVVGPHELSSMSDADRSRVRRTELGFVFQSDNLLSFLTATENVSLQLAIHEAAGGWERSRALLDALGLADRADHLPDQLSGGQRQRVAVARALVHRPRMILADEPTGSLDDATSALLLDVLLGAQQAAGATLIVATHDEAVAARLERTVVLRDGRVVADTAASGQG